jgi:hypothetical protein
MKSVAMPNVMIPQAYTITLDWSVPRNEILAFGENGGFSRQIGPNYERHLQPLLAS